MIFNSEHISLEQLQVNSISRYLRTPAWNNSARIQQQSQNMNYNKIKRTENA